MAAAGVDRAVLVPPGWDPAGNAVSLAAAVSHPDRFAVMGGLDITDPAAPGKLSHWREQSGMLGLRLSFNSPAKRRQLIDGSADWFWAEAERVGLPVMLLIPDLLPWAAEIAGRHPALRIIIDKMHRSPHHHGGGQLPAQLGSCSVPQFQQEARNDVLKADLLAIDHGLFL
jgi:predicted TIM-barrel fold metal-dependent hydrolase